MFQPKASFFCPFSMALGSGPGVFARGGFLELVAGPDAVDVEEGLDLVCSIAWS